MSSGWEQELRLRHPEDAAVVPRGDSPLLGFAEEPVPSRSDQKFPIVGKFLAGKENYER